MKITFTAFLLVWLLGAPALSAPQDNNSNSAGLSIAIRPTLDYVKLCCSPVTVEETLTNTSEHDLKYFHGRFPDSIDVRDDKGAPVKTTIEGDVLKGKGHIYPPLPDGSFIMLVRMDNLRLLTLGPNESQTYELEVSRYFDFQQPGKYTIQVKRREQDIVVKSNVITVTVLP